MKKIRLTYGVIFSVLFLVEVLIGLFVHDDFIRPYIGDVLVTTLICFLCRIVLSKGVPALPVWVFVFATFVEVAQYFEIVKLLRLEGNALFSTIIGSTFSFIDILCYGVGCLLFLGLEKAILSFFK